MGSRKGNASIKKNLRITGAGDPNASLMLKKKLKKIHCMSLKIIL